MLDVLRPTEAGHALGGSASRWRARALLEDRRRAEVQSAVTSEGISSNIGGISWQNGVNAASLGGVGINTPHASVEDAVDAIENARGFAVIDELSNGQLLTDPVVLEGRGQRIVRKHLHPELVVAIAAAASDNLLPRELILELEEVDDADEVAEAVANRFSNSSASLYCYDATSEWSDLAGQHGALQAWLHLAPSGLVTYTLSPKTAALISVDAPGAWEPSWRLSGEGCWKVLPPDASPTEVVLEMRHGLSSTGARQSSNDDIASYAPFQFRVDLQKCIRLVSSEAIEEASEYEHEEDEG